MYIVLCVCVFARSGGRGISPKGSRACAPAREGWFMYTRDPTSRRVPATKATATAAAAVCDPRGKRIKLPPRREQRTIRRAIREGGVEVLAWDGGEGGIARRNEPDIGEVSSAGCGFFILCFFSLFVSRFFQSRRSGTYQRGGGGVTSDRSP